MGHPLIFMFDFMLALLALILMFIFGTFYVHVSQFNTYVGETEQIARRAGGFNSSVEYACNDLSRKFYLPNGTEPTTSKLFFYVRPYNYQVQHHTTSDPTYANVSYGHVIRYRVFTRIPMARHVMSTYGLDGTPISVTSRVRKNTQTQVYDNYNGNL